MCSFASWLSLQLEFGFELLVEFGDMQRDSPPRLTGLQCQNLCYLSIHGALI